MLTVAGLHVPLNPLTDVFTNAGTEPPSQMVSVVPYVNVGVMLGFTVTVNVTGVAHMPGAGVKV